MTEGRKHKGHGPEEPAVEAEVVSSDPAPPSVAPESAEPPVEEHTLEQQLEQARAEAASHLDDARRMKAEFENYRKRMLKEQTALVDAASSSLVE